MIGKIHSFETFGTVDGPGIRFVIFMQGCPLQCKFCHNRDTWDTSCGTEYTVEDVIEKIMKYKPYIVSSNGGVTISGGEPLLQQDFVLELLKNLKSYNIHTAIDTSGFVSITPKIKEILEYTDLVLLDIKQIDEEKCINLTGQTNKFALEFAKYLNEINKPTWIRQVFIPTLTDDLKDIEKLQNFISSLNNVKKVEILPYHDHGKFKWTDLGLKYELENIPIPTNEQIQELWGEFIKKYKS